MEKERPKIDAPEMIEVTHRIFTDEFSNLYTASEEISQEDDGGKKVHELMHEIYDSMDGEKITDCIIALAQNLAIAISLDKWSEEILGYK